MDIIDDEGRLFGVVNVIDALVVLLVLAVVIAGAVFILSGAPGEDDVRYATIDLGEQPSHVVENIEAGDVMELEASPDNLTITDVYYGPGADGHLVVRAELQGERVEIDEDRYAFHFDGEQFRAGGELTIETPDYEATGTVTRLDTSGESLQTSETELFATTTVSAAVAEELSVGDTYTVAGEPVATIEALQVYPGSGDSRVALLGLSVVTYERGNTARYGPTAIRIGTSVPFETGTYSFSAAIIEPGSSTIDTSETSVILETTVPTDQVDDIDPGDTFQAGGDAIATIQERTVAPTGDPATAHLRLGITYSTHAEDDAVMFGDTEVRVGAELPFRTGDYSLVGAVADRDSSSVGTDPHEVVIETSVDRLINEDIMVGDTYEIAGHEVATIETKTIYPTPDRDTKRVLLGLTIETFDDGEETFFGDRLVRLGTSIPVRTADYDISGAIVTRGTLDKPGEPTTTEVTVQLRNVRPERAERIQEGMTETIDGVVLAEITNKATQPAEVILESEDGDIFLREHPTNLDIELTVELQTRETETVLEFHGEDIREGDTIVLDLGRIIIQPELVSINE